MEIAIFICVLANLIVSIAALAELRLNHRERHAVRIDEGKPNSTDTASEAVASKLLPNKAVVRIDCGEIRRETEEEHDPFDGIDSVAATCSVLADKHGLTNREGEVLIQLARGYNCRSIADLLTISEATVKSHSLKVYRKLGVHSQQELITLVQSQ